MSDDTPLPSTYEGRDLPEEGLSTPTPPDDFGEGLLAQFEKRTTTTAAPADEFGMAYPGGTSVDSSEQFAAMAAEITAATVAGEAPPEVEQTADPAVSTQPPGEPDEPAGVAEEPAPVEPGGYVWQGIDPTSGAPVAQRYDDKFVQDAIHIRRWADALSDDLRYALGAVESGQAVAIDRADYDQFQAWRNQQTRGQRDTDLARLDVEPEVAKVIADLRDEVASLRGGNQLPPQQQQPAYNPAITQATTQAIDTYKAARQLSQDETNALVNNAAQSGIIGFYQQQGQVVNPATGMILAPADPASVMYKALDYALTQNPALHAAVVARTQTPPPLTGQPDQAAAPNATVTDISAKRARAASLSAAPSAAVTPSPRTVLQMTDQQRIEGIAGEIARAQSGTG